MKRTIISIICFFILISACSCSPARQDDGRITIVTTVFPVYDWVRNIAADTGAEVIMLIDTGVDLHSYQPTVDDMVRISECDMFIYIGGESDRWADEIAETVTGEGTDVISLMDVLGSAAIDEEMTEGMEQTEEETGKDEHVWLSLKNAVIFCGYITDRLCALDEDSKETYMSNCASYTEELRTLDGRFEDTVSGSEVRTLLFGDRFPFLYLVSDYGLDHYAAFAGCSAETEASFNTVMFLADKTDELGLRYIMKTESSDGRLAETIRNATETKDQTILTLDSMQSVSSEDVKNGVTYIGIMEENLRTLEEALKQGE